MTVVAVVSFAAASGLVDGTFNEHPRVINPCFKGLVAITCLGSIMPTIAQLDLSPFIKKENWETHSPKK